MKTEIKFQKSAKHGGYDIVHSGVVIGHTWTTGRRAWYVVGAAAPGMSNTLETRRDAAAWLVGEVVAKVFAGAAADKARAERRGPRDFSAPTGYVHCACRDCMEIAIGPVGTMCSDCTEALCDAFYTECRRSDAYGGAEDETEENDDLPDPCTAYGNGTKCEDGADHCFDCGRHLSGDSVCPKGCGEVKATPKAGACETCGDPTVQQRCGRCMRNGAANTLTETSTITVPREPTAGMTARRDHGTLCNYRTGDAIRAATAAEREESVGAAASDGGAGVIEVEGIQFPCYVSDNPFWTAPTCECSAWGGVPCDEPREVAVEWMPPHHRRSHAAAGNRGSYPSNGALRLRVSNACAESMLESDSEWTVRL